MIGPFLLLLSLLSTSEVPLTVEEAAALAARSSPPAAVSWARLEEARARARFARSRLGPSVSLEAGFLASDDPVDAFALALKQQRFSAAEFFASDPNHPGTAKDWNAAVSATWTADLFGGLRQEVRAAEKTAQASERLAARARDGAAFEAVIAFSRAWRSEQRLALLAERLEDAARDVDLADSLREQGVTTAADPARARAALSEARSEQAAEEAALAAARADLAALIGARDASRPLSALPALTVGASSPASATASDRTALTAKDRDDAAAARLGVESARAAESAAATGRWPSLVLQARYQAHAPRADARWGDSSSAMAALRVPIFASGAVGARIAEARAAREEAEAQERVTLASAEAETASARAALAAAKARLAAFTEAESASRTARDIQRARYEEGAASLADLLESRAAELRARLGSVSARAERAAAEARWRLAVGLPPQGAVQTERPQ